jgi:hypothetical protein
MWQAISSFGTKFSWNYPEKDSAMPHSVMLTPHREIHTGPRRIEDRRRKEDDAKRRGVNEG